MANTEALVDSGQTAPARIEQRLTQLKQGLHRAYCMAVCVDRALRCNLSDDSPELAVCVSDYLVRPLDALSVEAEELRQVFEAPRANTESLA